MSDTTARYLNDFISQNSRKLSSLKRGRNGITVLKLLLFGVICWLVYSLVVSAYVSLWIALFGAGVAFLVMTVLDSRQVTRIELTESLLSEAKLEQDYLRGDKSKLSTGKQYLETNHPYAHDLDVLGDDSLFQSINRTVTPRGERMLSSWLLKGELSMDRLYDRQKAVKELGQTPDAMFLFRAWARVFPVTHSDEETIEKWASSRPFIAKRWQRVAIYLSGAINILLWIGVIFSLVDYSIPLNLSIIQLVISFLLSNKINRQQKEGGELLGALGNLYYLVQHIRTLSLESSLLQKLGFTLLGEHNSLIAFRLLQRRMEGIDQRNNILVSVVLNALFMRDLHQIIALDGWRRRYSLHLNDWIDGIAHFDALFSLANYRHNHPDFIFPKFSHDTLLKADSLAHPLISSDLSIGNDFEIREMHHFSIITGANMSGKSTFLRSVGTNFVLALAGSVVSARAMECRPIDLFTSMRTTDNLAKGTSYFHAELLRLQQLVTIATEGTPLFIILDEMLKGTNSEDKLNGSYRFLERLICMPLSGIVATHDLELGRLHEQFPQHFHNYCFEINHLDEQIVYDYKLKEGVSKNMNASILLKQMGLI